MTVADKPPLVEYIEDGSTVTFPVGYRYLHPTDLAPVRFFIDGTSQVLRYGTDFTATPAPTDDGGTLTVTAPAPAGTILRIPRDTVREQDSRYTTVDLFPAATVEGDFDQLMLIVQEIDGSISDADSRAVRVPIGETIGNLPPAAQRANMFLAFDAAGEPVISPGTDAGLRYFQTAPYEVKIGYDPISDTPASVKIGSNTAFDGLTGVMQIGGAGPRDGGNGSYLANDSHPNWNVIQSTIPFSPTEFNIYGNGTGGVATSDGSDTVTRSTGQPWGSFMIGRHFWFDGDGYIVVSATANTVVLEDAAIPETTATWAFANTTGTGTCTVSGGTVTRTIGDPFIPHTFTSDTFDFTLNGSPYTVTNSVDPNTCIISSPPPGGTYSYGYRANINDQIATIRLQATAGADEENLTMFAAAYGYVIGAQFSGNGKYKPLHFLSEQQSVLEIAGTGKAASLGGPYSQEAARFVWEANTVNRTEFYGAPTGTTPTIRARGPDTNVGFTFDTQGTGPFNFTSGAFGRTNFTIYGSNGPDFLTVDAGTGVVPIAASGGSTNIDILLQGKGTGGVRIGPWASSADAAINGYVTVHDYTTGAVRKLATIA
jgi:hypothetical protein